MPLIRTYTFEYKLIEVTIQAYSYEEAMEKLVDTVKYPADFKLKSL